MSVVPIVEIDDDDDESAVKECDITPILTPQQQIDQWKIQAVHLMHTDYSDHIFKHLRSTELIGRPDQTYMDTIQGDLSPAMRAILLDWLVEVSDEYNLQPQTFYLCVAYIDRYLSSVAIERNRLQLVGLSCMLIASKYWEIYPPTIDDFVHICDSTYKKHEILECEKSVLLQIQYKLVVPTPWEFSRRMLACKIFPNDDVRALSEYLMEMTIQEVYYMQYPPSMLAASAALLAILTLQSSVKARATWTPKHEHASGYTVEALIECARMIHATHVRITRDIGSLIEQGNAGWKAVKEKYTSAVNCRSANFVPLERVDL